MILNWIVVAFFVVGSILVYFRFQGNNYAILFAMIPYALGLAVYYSGPRRWLTSLSVAINMLGVVFVVCMFFMLPTLLHDYGHYGRSYVVWSLMSLPLVLNVVVALKLFRNKAS